MDGWSRARIGWVDYIDIEYDGYYAVQPLEVSGQTYRITKGFPEGEYLVIENKQPIKYDSDMPAGGKYFSDERCVDVHSSQVTHFLQMQESSFFMLTSKLIDKRTPDTPENRDGPKIIIAWLSSKLTAITTSKRE